MIPHPLWDARALYAAHERVCFGVVSRVACWLAAPMVAWWAVLRFAFVYAGLQRGFVRGSAARFRRARDEISCFVSAVDDPPFSQSGAQSGRSARSTWRRGCFDAPAVGPGSWRPHPSESTRLLWAQTVSSVRGSGRIGELNGDGYRGRCRSRTGGVWGRKIWCT
jgi:hypothetical protein